MGKQIQLGCKKCGGVIGIETQPWGERLDLRVKDGTVQETFGKIEIRCKKCNQPVAAVNISQV